MTKQTDANATDEPIDDCDLSHAERNRYFHGKLMTARDMAAEQRYHRNQRTRQTRHVTGYGVVEGLQASVTDVERGLEVTIEPGYALDCCGRPVVVPHETTELIEDAEIRELDRLALFLEYAECVTESVPIPGSEDACERECAYNRVVETFSLRVEPSSGRGKPVPPIEFPTKDDFTDDEPDIDSVFEYKTKFHDQLRETVSVRPASELRSLERTFSTDGGHIDALHPALDTIARSFDEVEDRDGWAPLGCTDDDDHAIYLGEFELPTDGGTTDLEIKDRSRVYSNDLLYAAIARHTADFGNPHDVVATLNGLAGDLTLASADDSIAITPDGNGQIDLSAGAADRLQALVCAMNAFAEVAESFENEAAGDLEDAFRAAIDSGEIAPDAGAYLAFLAGSEDVDILGKHGEVSDQLGAYVGGQDAYDEHVEALQAAVDDGDARAAARAQLLVSSAARQLRGQRLDLGRFVPNHNPSRPLTLDSVIFDMPPFTVDRRITPFRLVDPRTTDIGQEEDAAEDAEEGGSGDDDLAQPTFRAASFEGIEEAAAAAVEEIETMTAVTYAARQPGPTLPRAILAFQAVLIDVPKTTYVEADLLISGTSVQVGAFDRDSELVADETLEGAGERTVVFETDDRIDRLVLWSPQRAAGLEELRIR